MNSRYADDPAVSIDESCVPEQFRSLLGLARIWCIGDDVERDDYMEASSIEAKRELVEAVRPHFDALDRWSAVEHERVPVRDEVILLDGLALAAAEARLEVDGEGRQPAAAADGLRPRLSGNVRRHGAMLEKSPPATYRENSTVSRQMVTLHADRVVVSGRSGLSNTYSAVFALNTLSATPVTGRARLGVLWPAATFVAAWLVVFSALDIVAHEELYSSTLSLFWGTLLLPLIFLVQWLPRYEYATFLSKDGAVLFRMRKCYPDGKQFAAFVSALSAQIAAQSGDTSSVRGAPNAGMAASAESSNPQTSVIGGPK